MPPDNNCSELCMLSGQQGKKKKKKNPLIARSVQELSEKYCEQFSTTFNSTYIVILVAHQSIAHSQSLTAVVDIMFAKQEGVLQKALHFCSIRLNVQLSAFKFNPEFNNFRYIH